MSTLANAETELKETYQAVLKTGGWFPARNVGPLNIEGPDQIDFIQRQTTNDLRQLQPGEVITTVLTTPTARILDVLRVYQHQDRLQVITLPGTSQKTYDFLKSRIFFNDKVKIANLDAQFVQIELIGPAFPEALKQFESHFDSTAGAQPVIFSANEALYLPREEKIGLGGSLLLPNEALPAWTSWAQENNLVEISSTVREILRLEAGLPGSGAELSEAYTPLEVGLRSTISSTKGCYTGQEVIARQITYDKIVKQLYQLQLAEEASVGSQLKSDGAPAGDITSSVFSPRFGWIALAVLKSKYVDSDEVIHLASAQESSVTIQDEPWIRI